MKSLPFSQFLTLEEENWNEVHREVESTGKFENTDKLEDRASQATVVVNVRTGDELTSDHFRCNLFC